jgi:arginyl-tRNA synthetase
MESQFKEHIAGELAKRIRRVYADQLDLLWQALDTDESGLAGVILGKIETPKDRKLGDFAFPTFILAKAFREKPPQIAEKLASVPVSGNGAARIRFESAGPYVNSFLSVGELARTVLSEIFEKGSTCGSATIGTGKSIVIDFSSPNIAKPFGIGHLRSTAIGNSLYRIYSKLGYDCIGINHLGDWGTQFGKLIVAYKRWGSREMIDSEPIKALYELYVRFHEEEEKDPELTEEARSWFKKLEDGDAEARELWELFYRLSLDEFKRVYELLGVKFDHYTGESYYNDKIDTTIERLAQAGLTKQSRGALVVDLEEYNLPPCILRKADGATLYATRDLAGIFYRYETYKFHKALYVVGVAQRDHFKQVFKVIELLGEPYADGLVHVPFGWIKFDEQHMSTRRGNIIYLDDVISMAHEKVIATIKEKNPELPDLEKTALQVAIGAILFADLSVRKHKDVNFSWDEVLNFEGATGPYLQYSHARLAALERRYGREINGDVDFHLFKSDEEKELLLHLARFGRIIEMAADQYEPNVIVEYLLNLATVFNRFYQRKDEAGRLVRIISENEDETSARMLLVNAVRTVLCEGLYLLGIEAPQEM